MTATVGEIGGRLDILVKVGTTVGPFQLKFQKPDGTYANFTGYTLRAKARTRTTPTVSVAMVATLTDAGETVLLSATKVESAKFETPASMSVPPKIADWDLEAEAADGTLTTLLYGEIRSHLRLPVGA